MHNAPEIDAHDPLEILIGGISQHLHMRHAGVVDHQVNLAETLDDVITKRVHRRAVGYVHVFGQDIGIATGGFCINQPGVVDVTQRQTRALFGGLPGQRAADTGPRAGNDHDAFFEIVHCRSALKRGWLIE